MTCMSWRAPIACGLLGLVGCGLGVVGTATDRAQSAPEQGAIPTSPAPSTGSTQVPAGSDRSEERTASDAGDAGPTSPDASPASTSDSRRAAIERFYRAACIGGLGLTYRGKGRDTGTGTGAYFGRYAGPRTCTIQAATDCTAIVCSNDAVPTSSFRGDVTYSSTAGNRSVGRNHDGNGYDTGTTNATLLPRAGDPVDVVLRPSGPNTRHFGLPSPGAVQALVAPARRAKIARDRGVTVEWTNADAVAGSTVLVRLDTGDAAVECLVDAARSSVDVSPVLTQALPAGVGVVTVTAVSERFDDDDDCVVMTRLTRIPGDTPSASVTFE